LGSVLSLPKRVRASSETLLAPLSPSSPAAMEEDPDETFLRPISDLAAVRACYDRYGVVGVTGVLSPDECQALITEGIEPCLPAGCHVDDPSTHRSADAAVNRYGVIGKKPLFNRAILSARLHPRVVEAYSAVYGHDSVVACHDRAAWMRPTALDAAVDTPFTWPGLHVDVSLRGFYENHRADVDSYLSSLNYLDGGFVGENNAKHVSMGRTVQGVLSLIDNDDEDGGFHCVPGFFERRLQEWTAEHRGLPTPEVCGRYDLKAFGPDAQLGAMAQRVPCPAGTLLLFDATLPHGTRPNFSTRSRLILFLRYVSADALPTEAWGSRNAALRRVTEQLGFDPDDRQQRHLFGPEQ